MNPYLTYLRFFEADGIGQLYDVLGYIAMGKMGLDELPFSLSALEHPPGNVICPTINLFIMKAFRASKDKALDADKAIHLIQFLKNNPPPENYENPKLSDKQATPEELCLMEHIFYFGIDLPGSKHNPFGHLQYFSNFFIDIFFGNFTEGMNHLKSLSKIDLKKTLSKREGHCQFSPIFAPILGLQMVDLEHDINFSTEEKQRIRLLYSGNNENKHQEIIKKLLKYGADPNAHDIYGYTPLHYAVHCGHERMVSDLLNHGADPNAESRDGRRPLTLLRSSENEYQMDMIEQLLQYNAKLTDKLQIFRLRESVENHGRSDLAVRVRLAMPREKGECEKCSEPAVKKCSACGLVYYCTPVCQKMDWKFHKLTSHKN